MSNGGSAECSVKRVTGSERELILVLSIMLEMAYNVRENLWIRAGLHKRTRSKLACMRGLIQSVMEDILETVPEEQRRSLYRNMQDATYCTGVKSPVARKRRDDDFGIWLSFEQINTLLEAVVQNKCLLCSEEHEYKCQVRKMLDEMGSDIEHYGGGKCGYRFL